MVCKKYLLLCCAGQLITLLSSVEDLHLISVFLRRWVLNYLLRNNSLNAQSALLLLTISNSIRTKNARTYKKIFCQKKRMSCKSTHTRAHTNAHAHTHIFLFNLCLITCSFYSLDQRIQYILYLTNSKQFLC